MLQKMTAVFQIISDRLKMEMKQSAPRSRRRRMPGDRIAKHLSERAPTVAGIHVILPRRW